VTQVAYKALLIGVSTYQDLFSLEAPDRDLSLLNDALISAQGSPFTEDSVIVLHSPTLAVAQRQLFEFLTRAETDDTLLIYFSGHSDLDRDELYLLLADADLGNGISGGLAVGRVSAALEKTQASSVFLILNTSYAGSFKLPDSPRLKDDPTSYYFIGSVGPTEQARDTSVFAEALASALRGSMASDPGLDPQSIFDDVFEQLAAERTRPFYASRGGGVRLQRQAPSGPDKKSVFISYAHEDQRWLNKLRPHLQSLVQDEAEIRYWDDGSIQPGQDWRQEIRNQLSAARAAVLLVSADFLASDFVRNDELPTLLSQAESRRIRLYCLIIRPCRFDKVPLLSRFQAVNEPDKTLSEMRLPQQERIFERLIDQLEQALL
jgi:TIR domain/Caspase domain